MHSRIAGTRTYELLSSQGDPPLQPPRKPQPLRQRVVRRRQRDELQLVPVAAGVVPAPQVDVPPRRAARRPLVVAKRDPVRRVLPRRREPVVQVRAQLGTDLALELTGVTGKGGVALHHAAGPLVEQVRRRHGRRDGTAGVGPLWENNLKMALEEAHGSTAFPTCTMVRLTAGRWPAARSWRPLARRLPPALLRLVLPCLSCHVMRSQKRR